MGKLRLVNKVVGWLIIAALTCPAPAALAQQVPARAGPAESLVAEFAPVLERVPEPHAPRVTDGGGAALASAPAPLALGRRPAILADFPQGAVTPGPIAPGLAPLPVSPAPAEQPPPQQPPQQPAVPPPAEGQPRPAAQEQPGSAPAAESSKGSSVGPALTITGVLVGATFGLLATQSASDAKDASKHNNKTKYDQAKSDYETEAILSGVGYVLAAVGVLVWVVESSSSGTAEAENHSGFIASSGAEFRPANPMAVQVGYRYTW